MQKSKEAWIKKYNMLISKISTKIKCCKRFYYKNPNYFRVLSSDGLSSMINDSINMLYINPEVPKSDIVVGKSSLINSLELPALNNENSN